MKQPNDMRGDPRHPDLIDQSAETQSLIPNSGIQFLDYVFDADLVRRLSFRFHDELRELPGKDGSRRREVIVNPLEEETEPDADGEPVAEEDKLYRSLLSGGLNGIVAEDTYSITGPQALKWFDRRWLPVPYFRLTNEGGRIDEGPTNWARVCISAPGPNDPPGSLHRLVLAFDTETLERRDDLPYAAPDNNDAADPLVGFAWARDLARQCSFAGGEWQRPWIEADFRMARPKSKTADMDGIEQRLGEPWAAYSVLLQCLQATIKFPTISLVDVASLADEAQKRGRKVTNVLDVALVLDVGNSRTCGILVEQGIEDDNATLGQPPARLQLRDLSRPERLTSDPFDSRVEFQAASFGRREFGRRSKRSTYRDAFWWPSPLRTGPEAAWLKSLSDGRDGVSGMSSPKRYVWDTARRPQGWVNNRAGRPETERVPPISSPISSQLTEDGRIGGAGRSLGLETAYSRSSLYMLMIAEVICHAIGQINSVSYRRQRANTDLPRRLSKIFLTLPSATPIAEQRRMERLARQAIDLVWNAYRWGKGDWLHPKPKLVFDLDEATCTQLVYLYNELEHRFREFPESMFNTVGRGRRAEDGSPALRLASLDIGGGTTDLMIVEHTLHGEIITPKQLFREGFRQAGDDVLKRVIETTLLPALIVAIGEEGEAYPEQFISRLFSGDTTDVTRPEQVKRTLFVNEVLVPAALGLLARYERVDARFPSDEPAQPLGDLLDREIVSMEVLGYLDDAVEKQTSKPFSSLEVPVTMQASVMAGAVESVLGRALEDICDVVRAYNCDMLLLTGRPVAMPAVRDIVRACAPVMPERLVSMYGYRIGNWYPFRSDDMRIWDGKTTAAVGALLCHLCEGKFASFVFESRELMMASTARYIGKMDQRGQIKDVLFKRSEPTDGFLASMGPSMDIGYRQLPIERWVTSQLYHVFYRSEEIARETPKPVNVQLTFVNPDAEGAADDDELDVETRRREFRNEQFAREELAIDDAIDRLKNPCRETIDMRMQTFRTIDKLDAGYWLDTGVLSTSLLVSDDANA